MFFSRIPIQTSGECWWGDCGLGKCKNMQYHLFNYHKSRSDSGTCIYIYIYMCVCFLILNIHMYIYIYIYIYVILHIYVYEWYMLYIHHSFSNVISLQGWFYLPFTFKYFYMTLVDRGWKIRFHKKCQFPGSNYQCDQRVPQGTRGYMGVFVFQSSINGQFSIAV